MKDLINRTIRVFSHHFSPIVGRLKSISEEWIQLETGDKYRSLVYLRCEDIYMIELVVEEKTNVIKLNKL